MKRLRSSDDLDSYGDKNASKDSSNPNPNRSSTSSHRSFYYKSDNVRKGLVSTSSSLSRYDRDRSLDDDNRNVRKRSDHDFESFDRRKVGFDRYSSGGNDRTIHRSESFCGPRREFPKGFRSERDRSRREGSVSSWRRFVSGSKEFGCERKDFGGGNKEFEDSNRGGSREDRVGSGKGLRDVIKSPSWSRDSGSEQSRARGLGDSKSKSKSKSRSSPTWSKDSVGSEQSKNLEVVKKSEEVKIEGGGSSSEMEEGELEPDVERERVPDTVPAEVENKNEAKDNSTGADNENKKVEDGENVLEEAEQKGNKGSIGGDKKDDLLEVSESPDSENLIVGSGDESGKLDADEVEKEKEELEEEEEGEGEEKEECLGKGDDCKEEATNDLVVEKSTGLEEGRKEEKGIDLEVKAEEEIEVPQSYKEQIVEENGGDDVNSHMEIEALNQSFKDKGKSVAVTPTHDADSAENGVWIERESRVAAAWKSDDMEGPSNRGFDLFTSSPVRKAEEKGEQCFNNKVRDENLALEPLDLSLSLPNVLLPIGTRDTTEAPGSPSQGRSIQSLNTFRTNSDGFTASMSFSGSQSFFHNPSCSLTQNSMDNFEQSVHSRPIFQGIDQVSQGAWQGQSQNESSKHKEIPLFQRILMNGNGSIHQSQGIPNGQLEQVQHVRGSEGSTKMPNGLERQLSFHKQNDVRSPSNSVGSHEMGSSYSFEKKRAMREKHSGGSLYRSGSQKEQELLIGGVDFVETIMGRIVSDPFHVMARKFHDMTAQSIAFG
ncbi:hypothetical protein Pint_23975 [Pistacia integerrima]|uniref:Uncharacterized protein n=1 Tax=Pistacia integerrima TaxID=434235 RepID=A0ACC0YGU4_9ROSI|nr:hypothetical protein Pint_23975 [Pistacia integerrima]